METFQLDTYSAFHKDLAAWLSRHASKSDEWLVSRLPHWEKWDGSSVSDMTTFTELHYIGKTFTRKLVDTLVKHYQLEDKRYYRYDAYMKEVWLRHLLRNDNSLLAFGVTDSDMANQLIAIAKKHFQINEQETYAMSNRWTVQHLLANDIPVFGRLFRVDDFPQTGSDYAVKVELPNAGAAFRTVWDLSDPSNSTWIFPVGKSGHIGSSHYSDQHSLWAIGTKRLSVFTDTDDWGF